MTILRKTFSLICFIAIFAKPLLAMQDIKIEKFIYKILNEESVQITSLILRSGHSSIKGTFFDPPQAGKIVVISDPSSAYDALHSFDELIAAYMKNPSIKFGVIQIGRLDNDEKVLLRAAIDIHEFGIYYQLIEALRRAKVITFETRFYDVSYQFDKFLKEFNGTIRS